MHVQGSMRTHAAATATAVTHRPLIFLRTISIVLVCVMIARLFVMQVVQHDFYTALAAGTQDIYRSLLPKRGAIYVQDRSRSTVQIPLALHRTVYQAFLDNADKPEYGAIADRFASVFAWNKADRDLFYDVLKNSKPESRYVPLPGQDKLTDDQRDALGASPLRGLHFAPRPYRYYPEGNFASHILGFYGLGSDGKPKGSYGIEGYYQTELAGQQGFIEGKRDAFGGWIPVASREHRAARDGADIVLTIDQTIQLRACEELERIAKESQSQSAASIIMNPKTGEIMAMCSYPTFDPNTYNKVDSIEVYNNHAIFTPYEPGSIFKTITMAAALDKNVISPELTFDDPGSRQIDGFTIYNAQRKNWGRQSMTGVLEHSINTGMILTVEKLGRADFAEYIDRFGFGQKTGIELNSEGIGTIASLQKKGLIYAATASFGQGITVTPIQMVQAYGALANGGVMMKPTIVRELRYPDGQREINEPRVVRRVMSPQASFLISGMLTSVIETTYRKVAAVPGYHFGGKTGTAQIAGQGGYTEETNHSFVGYGPVEDPQFVIFSKFEKPQREWAESTAAPYFGKMAQFLVQYLRIPPSS
jgi:stage V sporulation protein D (sporulation-specific penicillin-binding protein)